MKKVLSMMLIVGLCAFGAFGQVELSDIQQGVFYIAAQQYVAWTGDRMAGLPLNWRAEGDVLALGKAWVKMESSVATGKVYPDEVYVNFMSRYDADSLRYGIPEVLADNAAPSGCVASAGQVSCDDPANGKTLALFLVSGTTFTDTEESAVDGVFSGLAAATYVVGYTGNEFCTPFLVVE